MKRFAFAIAATSILCAAQPAEAKRHHHRHAAHGHHRHAAAGGDRVHRGAGERPPGAWCGWQMRRWFGGGPEYNLAANWAHRGRPAAPGIGAIVVWPHHVGVIVGRAERGFIIKSGNDGGAVRARPRSIAGAIAFRRI